MRNIGPKTRLARRIGQALRDKDTKYLVKRNYPPGMHGQARRRLSEYAVSMLEKQKAKWTYDVSERQFRRYVAESIRKKQLTSHLLFKLLELRLDNVVYRLGFAPSRAAARQLVSHGFINVNSKKVNCPSYQVRAGDEISVVENKKNTNYVKELSTRLKNYKTLEWLSLDAAALKGKVLSLPTLENTGSTLQMDLIIEHYSR
jgi:small subunit ribosomal protein S4